MELFSISEHHIKGRGKLFVIKMPVECIRSAKAVKEALGNPVMINNEPHEIAAIECFMPNTLIGKGEKIGILVS